MECLALRVQLVELWVVVVVSTVPVPAQSSVDAVVRVEEWVEWVE